MVSKIKCLYCKGQNIVKYGSRRNRKGLTQVYFCKSCSRRFTPRDGFRRMKHDKKAVCAALDCYARGMSLRGVRHHLKMFYGINVSHVGVLYWIRKYGKLIKEHTDGIKIKPKKLYADETAIPFNKQENWLWNVMDAKSRFWVTANLSIFKDSMAADKTFGMVKSRLSEVPDFVATDGAFPYVKTVKKFFPNTEHYRYIKPEEKEQMQVMERLNGSIKQRTKVMRGMWCTRTARHIINLLQIHYNFIRPHSSLYGRTPAEVMEIVPRWDDNKWENLIEWSDLNEGKEN